MPLRALLFDFGGILDADGITWLDRFLPLYMEEGVAASPERMTRAFYDSDDSLPARHRLAGLGLHETLRLQVRGVLEAVAPGRLDRAEAIAGRFLAASRERFAANRGVLERLKERYRLGIVSNFYGNLESVLASEGLLGLFDAVADSGAVGARKPEAALFRHALSRLGAEPSSAMMVGDSLARDMRGAEALGMAHAWLRPNPPPPSPLDNERGLRGPAAVEARCCTKGLVLSTLAGLEPALEEAAA